MLSFARILTASGWMLCVLAAATQTSAAGFAKWSAANKGLELGTGAGVTTLVSGGEQKPIAYAIVDGMGLFRSPDWGESWSHLKGETPPLKKPYAIAVSPRNGYVLFAAGEEKGQGLWRSADGGVTWKPAGSKATGLADDDVQAIAVRAEAADLILVGHRAGGAISVSTDGGKTWTTSKLGTDIAQQLPVIISRDKWVVLSLAKEVLRITEDGGRTWATPTGNAVYAPGPLPVIQTEGYLFSSSYRGTHRSADGGKSWTYLPDRNARMIGTLGSLLVREDRAEVSGQDARRLTITVSADYAATWEDVTGTLVDLVPQTLQSCVTVQNNDELYGRVRLVTAWAAASEPRQVLLGLGKAGVFRGVFLQTKQGPWLLNPSVQPFSLMAGDDVTPLVISVRASPRSGQLKRVYADCRALEAGEIELFDDGKHEDGQAGDQQFANRVTLSSILAAGNKPLGIVAEDAAGNLSSVGLNLKIAAADERLIVWDGEQFASGRGACDPGGDFNFVRAQAVEAHNGKAALEFHGDLKGGAYRGCWNWYGGYPLQAGTDIRSYRNLSFWVKVVGDRKRTFSVGLQDSTHNTDTAWAPAADYVLPVGADLLDGQWHEVRIPLVDLCNKPGLKFDAAKAWQIEVSTSGPEPAKFSIYLDEIGFNNRQARSRPPGVAAAAK